MSDANKPPAGLLLSSDLFFSSKITGTAEVVGLKIRVFGSAAKIIAAIGESSVRFLIVDLSLPGLNIGELTAGIPADSRPEIIAYDAHVRTDQLAAAKAAGCDAVLSRGQLSSGLSEILGRFVDAAE